MLLLFLFFLIQNQNNNISEKLNKKKKSIFFLLFPLYFYDSNDQAAWTPQVQNLMICVIQHDHCHIVYF